MCSYICNIDYLRLSKTIIFFRIEDFLQIQIIMKKLILFALSAMAGLSGLQAQTFRPFCEEGKTWKSDSYMRMHPSPFSTWTVETWKMEGDTLIGGHAAKCMFRAGTYVGAFYDEAYLTYFIAQIGRASCRERV